MRDYDDVSEKRAAITLVLFFPFVAFLFRHPSYLTTKERNDDLKFNIFCWQELGLIRKPSSFMSSICDERGAELLYAGMPITEVFKASTK